IDTNSRLCMASSVAGHKRAFGADTVPGNYEDLELADLVVLVGSNLAWCHPVLYQRLAKAKAERPGLRVVVIDPRRPMTCDIADLHLAVAADSDTAVSVGLSGDLARRKAIDIGFIENHTAGFGEALRSTVGWSTACVAEAAGLTERDVAQFYDWFAGT